MNNQLWDRIADDLLVAAKFHELEQPQRNNDGETMRKAAMALLEASKAVPPWQPIATAPRDWLLLVKADTGSGGPYSGFFDLAFFNGVYWHDQEMRSLEFKPAAWKFIDEREPPNWQPLPPPPAAPAANTTEGER